MSEVTKKTKFKTVDEILDYAISKEQESKEIYTKIAANAGNKAVRQLFERCADEEEEHKQKLKIIRDKKYLATSLERLVEVDIPNFKFEQEKIDRMTVSDALQFAIRREKAAYMLYARLAEASQNVVATEMLEKLALEESKHQMKIEVENESYLYA